MDEDRSPDREIFFERFRSNYVRAFLEKFPDDFKTIFHDFLGALERNNYRNDEDIALSPSTLIRPSDAYSTQTAISRPQPYRQQPSAYEVGIRIPFTQYL